MEVNGQIHAPAYLPPGKSLLVPIGSVAGLTSESLWTLWEREKSCHSGNPTPASQPEAHLYTDSAVPHIYCFHICSYLWILAVISSWKWQLLTYQRVHNSIGVLCYRHFTQHYYSYIVDGRMILMKEKKVEMEWNRAVVCHNSACPILSQGK
jgi:hypothetical protein